MALKSGVYELLVTIPEQEFSDSKNAVAPHRRLHQNRLPGSAQTMPCPKTIQPGHKD